MCSCPSHLFALAKAVFWYLTPLVVRRYHVVGGAAGTVSSIGGWLQGGGLSGSTGMRIWGFGVDQAGGCGIQKAEFRPPPPETPFSWNAGVSRSSHSHVESCGSTYIQMLHPPKSLRFLACCVVLLKMADVMSVGLDRCVQTQPRATVRWCQTCINRPKLCRFI